MKRSNIVTALFVLGGLSVGYVGAASSEAEQLAIDSYRHLRSYESRLEAAIRNGDRNRYVHSIEQPTSVIIDRWPSMGFAEFNKFRRCQLALISFRTWSDDYFNARGELPKSARSAKEYFEQRELCLKSLAGKV